MDSTYNFFEYFIFFYASSLFLLYCFLGILSFINIVRYKTYNSNLDDEFLLNSPLTPGISIIAPAYNEEKTIILNVKSLITLNYPKFEVIIINDGSKDKTLELLIEEFELVETKFAYIERIKTKPFKRIFKSTNPNYGILTVVDKENGGTKADASNAGINASQYPYFLCTDVDCILYKDTMLKMIKPILNSKVETIAVGATLRMSNSCDVENGVITRVKPPKQIIPLFQEMEYLRAYLFGKMGWALINCVPNVSGGLGLFNTEIAIKAGGYSSDSHAEDMDLTTKMAVFMIDNERKYIIDYIPISCCWTEGPPNVNILSRQRARWATGLAQIFVVHRKILFNPKYKKLGMVVFPSMFIFEFLAPIIEVLGVIWFILLLLKGDINWDMAGYIFLYSYSFAITIGSLVVLYDNFVQRQYKTFFYENFKLWLCVFFESFVYHPLIVWFSISGYFKYFASREVKWGTMTRQGIKEVEKKGA